LVDPSGRINTSGSTYAFPPVYPLLVGVINKVVGSVEVSAFIVGQFLLLLGFSLVYWLVAKWQSAELAAKTAWLVFIYPFSIFFRSYYSEGLFLVLLVVLMDALRSKGWFKAAVSAGLLFMTRFVGAAGIIVLALEIIRQSIARRLKLPKAFIVLLLSLLPLLAFMGYCYAQTGDRFYFISAQSVWQDYTPVVSVLWSIAHFMSLPWDFFHKSRLDVLSIVAFGSLIYLGRKRLPRPWLELAIIIWIIPILAGDTMSASRFQIVNLPVFIYAAQQLSGWKYRLVAGLSAAGLFAAALFFVNWTWLG